MANKVAIVTGGSRGIGASIVEKLASENYNILLNYYSNKEAAQMVADKAKTNSDIEIILYKADVSLYENAEKIISEAVNKWGRIDVLINNAGISRGGFLMMNKLERWWEVVNKNLGCVVNCTKAITQQMIKQKSGKIINIGSVSGIKGTVGNSDYSSSKAAISGFTRAIAKELVKFGIIVNCVAPGFIETDMTDEMPQQKKDAISQYMVPMKRMGKPEEVAELVALLASNKVNYILGQTIVIDGGTTI